MKPNDAEVRDDTAVYKICVLCPAEIRREE